MTARSNIKGLWTVLSVGALALAAVTFALPVDAKPKTPRQQCISECYPGDAICVENCVFWSRTTKKKAVVTLPARGPIAGTGAPARPTQLHRH